MISGETTWKHVVKEALEKIGGSGHLEKINKQIEGRDKTKTNPTWKATVRRTLQQYSIFYQKEKGSGVWFLKEEEPVEKFHPREGKEPGHEDVQGMLLELGKIYDYETTVPSYDRRKKFMGRELGDIVTLNEFPRFTGYEKVLKIVSLIDVMWFTGETDGVWVPSYAFEVWHTTGLTEGLGRLSDLYRSGQRAKLFVVLPENKIEKFEGEIGRSLFSQIKGICQVKTYHSLIEFYNSACEHQLLKTEFLAE